MTLRNASRSASTRATFEVSELARILGMRVSMTVKTDCVVTKLHFDTQHNAIINDEVTVDIILPPQPLEDTTTREVQWVFIDDQAAARLALTGLARRILVELGKDKRGAELDDKIAVTRENKDDGGVYILGAKLQHLSAKYLHEEVLCKHPDDGIVIVIDQNLDHPEGLVLGTDLASELLRYRHPHLVLVVRSANMSSTDQAAYRAAGFDHCVDKTETVKTLLPKALTQWHSEAANRGA